MLYIYIHNNKYTNMTTVYRNTVIYSYIYLRRYLKNRYFGSRVGYFKYGLLHLLDSMLKSRDITLLAKVHTVKAMVFPYVRM